MAVDPLFGLSPAGRTYKLSDWNKYFGGLDLDEILTGTASTGKSKEETKPTGMSTEYELILSIPNRIKKEVGRIPR